MRFLTTAALVAIAAATARGANPCARRHPRGAQGRRPRPRFFVAGIGRQDLQALGLQGQEGCRHRLVPQGDDDRLHHRVQVAGRERRNDQEVQRVVLHGQRRPAGRRTSSSRRRRAWTSEPEEEWSRRRKPTSRSSATRPRRRRRPMACSASAALPTAGRSTSARTARFSAIEKTIKPATSAEDMAAKLGELGVEPAKK